MVWSIRLREWVKCDEHPLAYFLRKFYLAVRSPDIPAPKSLWCFIDFIFKCLSQLKDGVLRTFLWTPMFKSRLRSCGKKLYLYGGIPYTAGPLKMDVGDHCRISGRTTITGRVSSKQKPWLKLGKNVDLGWMCTVAVGRRVILGDNVRVAGQCFLAGYPGHPLNAEARAAGLPDCDEQVGDIVLEDNVWLATGVYVKSGVTIGQGSVVAANSVVTKDMPAFSLVGGNPARVIRTLDQNTR